jgi:hypothetical protein
MVYHEKKSIRIKNTGPKKLKNRYTKFSPVISCDSLNTAAALLLGCYTTSLGDRCLMFETTNLPQNIWHHSPIHAVAHPTRMETSTALLQKTEHFTTLINQIKILQKTQCYYGDH